MAEKKFMGPIIGQAVNLLCESDPQFLKDITSDTIVDPSCKECAGKAQNSDNGTHTECPVCNVYVSRLFARISNMTKRLMVIDQCVSLTSQQWPGITEQKDVPKKTQLSIGDFLNRAKTQYGLKLYQDKKCIVTEQEEVVLEIARVENLPPGENRRFAENNAYLDVGGEEVKLQITEKNHEYLKSFKLPQKFRLSGKMIEGQYGKKLSASWSAV